jgi:SAM-dependent methyltransferase
MHHRAAGEPEFWDRLWDLDPPRPMAGQKISLWYRRPFEAFLPRDGLIIEAGCGNGNVMRTLSGAGYVVEGIDFAPRAIEANRAVDPTGRYRFGDVRDLPYADGALAGYLSFGVIEHFDDPTRAGILAEAARCLRPGGVAVVTTPHYSPLRRLRARLGRYDHDPGTLDFYQYLFTRRDLQAQLRTAGLTPVATEAYDLYKGLKDTLGIKPWLDRWNRLGPRARRWLHHPPRPLRMACCHMLMVIAKKQSAADERG